MKKIELLFILMAATCAHVHAQNCDKLLEGGLYSITGMTNTGSFSKDLRTYYLSNQFKTDIKSGKWGGSVTVPIDGIPVTLNSDFSEDRYSEFRSKLLSITELKISEDFYKTAFSTIPNTNLYDSYVECVKIINDVSKTGFIEGKNTETEDNVVFAIYYRPQAPGDPMPKVIDFNVQPEGSVISGAPITGQTLTGFSMLITCKRDPDKDLVLSLITDRGSYNSKSVAEGAFSSSSQLPIGTIVSSMLNFEQFNFTTKNNEKSPGGIWTSGKSKWAPCDGRSLPGSKYSKISSMTNAPDLRGLFARGLNSFDPAYTTPPADASQLNPDPMPVGVYQKDELKSHQHSIPARSKAYFAAGDTGAGACPEYGASETGAQGGNETRSKNISVYYYIRIN